MHIAIAGNIGAGKTTLTGMLAKHYGWTPHYEDVDENPYLNDFYEDMQRWSFNLQIYFLNSRFNQILDIHNSGATVIQDRTIYEDAEIFAPNLHAMGLMSTRDFQNYSSLFQLMAVITSYSIHYTKLYEILYTYFNSLIAGFRAIYKLIILF